MEIITRTEGRFIIVEPSGRLGFDEASATQLDFERAVDRADAGVVVDCASLSYVSSAGLRAFLVAAKAAETKGVSFSACSLDSDVASVFTISGFDRIVSIFDSISEATAG
ncbi:MAG: STAS domain-containing protein [Luminiphilus sp.]|nr:STAS domain-containing protein [Luminiphilus sp.]